ncbi:MAG TPA: hypothetical protein G4O03_05875 [Dehalococcoidia bacterium]|nr:hypothetical protein [Dehalococcoidia bacterium]
MRVFNSYIAVLVLIFTIITVALAAFGLDKLDVYFTAYALALLGLTVLYVYFSPRARRGLNMVGLAAFAGFLVVVALRVIEWLFGK